MKAIAADVRPADPGAHDDLLERFYPESRFGGFSDIDGTVVFYARVRALLRPDMTVLDVGCGRGAGLSDDPVRLRRSLRNLRGECRSVVGIDVDGAGGENPGVDEFRLIDDHDHWPVGDGEADLIVADFVLEHVENPAAFFSEVARALKPGGHFCARTTNRVGYVGLAARFVPRRRHAAILRKAQRDRAEVDVFPATYRANTVRRLRRALNTAGLEGVVYGYDAEPSYLQFSPVAYAFGRWLHGMTPRTLRTSLFAFARKPGRDAA